MLLSLLGLHCPLWELGVLTTLTKVLVLCSTGTSVKELPILLFPILSSHLILRNENPISTLYLVKMLRPEVLLQDLRDKQPIFLFWKHYKKVLSYSISEMVYNSRAGGRKPLGIGKRWVRTDERELRVPAADLETEEGWKLLKLLSKKSWNCSKRFLDRVRPELSTRFSKSNIFVHE